ncbi:MAG: FAD-dependent monooxygenase [Pseudomonadota bacterium]
MDFDAIVIGGGPSGAAAATRLAELGWHVAIIERAEFPRLKVCGEYLSWTNWEAFRRLGVWEEFASLAGPAIRRVAFFGPSRNTTTATLPAPPETQQEEWGRALTRDHLDSLLLRQAKHKGAVVFQPWNVVQTNRDATVWQVTIAPGQHATDARELTAPMILHAAGSWGRTPLDAEVPAARDKDLLGFKAHFSDAALVAGLMPLLAFPGGYGGMVTAQDGIVSLSCCVQQSRLRLLRSQSSASAGKTILEHIQTNIPAVAQILRGATQQGSWLAAGPIRPGRRVVYSDGVFRVGNAAGEAHPVVAEGISMAVQSGLLAADCISACCQSHRLSAPQIDQAGYLYRKRWHRAFALRIRASKAIAAWAMQPSAVRWSEPAIRRFPSILTAGARLGGKSHIINFQEQA